MADLTLSVTEDTDLLTGNAAEAKLHEFIRDESVDEQIIDRLLPHSSPHAWEGYLWDYKIKLPSTSGRGSKAEKEKANFEIAEIVKDVVAFHNSYGGYILAGIDQHNPNPIVGCDNLSETGFTVEKLNEQVHAYTRTKINCRFNKIRVGADGKYVGLLLVPQRKSDAPVVRFAKGAPQNNKKSQAFRKGEIYVRVDDTSSPSHTDVQTIQFLCSKRQFGETAGPRISLDHNLPAQDPNLIRFVGRGDYLLKLWNWMIDRHVPLKILTALGGTGKTSIAYEFCRQIISNPPSTIERAIWLTAKKQTFSAIQGRYVASTRSDFESVDGFFSALAHELGIMEDEITEATDRAELLDFVIDGLSTFPSLVVIDDIDSLELSDQADLFSNLQILSGRTFEFGNRFLITSRLELNAGENQRITIDGFELAEFTEYARMVAATREIKLNAGIIKRLHTASLGSPIFCDSILRLVSLGVDINTAIKNWRGAEGEDVRKFAFERELEQLTDSQARTLYALTALGQTTQIELKQALNIADGQITSDLSTLREFHLFATSGDPSTGAKLETPEPIRLMTDILKKRIHDPARVERECARLRKNVPKVQDKVAQSIGGVLALWKEDEYDAALLSAAQAQKENSKSGDLHCVLGQCYLKVTPKKPDEADKAFARAHLRGCQRPELIPNWLMAKELISDWNGIVDLCTRLPPTELNGMPALSHVNALLILATQKDRRDDLGGALLDMRNTMETASKIIAQGRAGDKLPEVRNICRNAAKYYVMISDRLNGRARDRIDLFNSVVEAFRCHVTETWMIELGVEAIQTYSDDIMDENPPDPSALDILDRRLDALGQIREHIEQSDQDRAELCEKVAIVEARIIEQLQSSSN